MRHYNAFLLRYWTREGTERRLEVTHLQSGEQLRTDSLAALLAWVRDHAADTDEEPRDQEAAPLELLRPP